MVATPIASNHRYLSPGIRRYYYLQTIANILMPTRAELDAGIDLTREVVDGSVKGFIVNGDTVDVPDAGSKFTGKVKGRQSVDNSSINIYCDLDSDDARATFEDTEDEHYIVIMTEGEYEDSKTKLMNVWPVVVLAAPAPDPTMSDGAFFMVSFAVPREPAPNVEIPAAADEG
jgi:hypothetical protein